MTEADKWAREKLLLYGHDHNRRSNQLPYHNPMHCYQSTFIFFCLFVVSSQDKLNGIRTW